MKKEQLFLMFVMALLPMTELAAQAFVKDGLVFRCYDQEEGALVVDVEDKSFTGEYVIPDLVVNPHDGLEYTVRIIDENAFDGAQMSAVTLPAGLVKIDEEGFNECVNLTAITFPSTVRYLGEDAFDGCTSLKTVTIVGTDLEFIVEGCFAGCTALTDIYIFREVASTEELPILGKTFEDEDFQRISLHVPPSSFDFYKAHEEWGKFFDIVMLTDEEMAAIDHGNGDSEATAVGSVRSEKLPTVRKSVSKGQLLIRSGRTVYNALGMDASKSGLYQCAESRW